MRAVLTALLLVPLVTGCVTTPRPPPAPPEVRLRLPPASLGGELALAQRITVTRGDERRSFDAQLEADATIVRIAAVAMGQVFATLSWDGATFDQRVASQVPEVVTAERILSDVQLAFWPAAAVRAGLPSSFRLEEEGLTRTLFDGPSLVATLEYQGAPPAWAHVTLTHHRYGYRLDIESVQQ